MCVKSGGRSSIISGANWVEAAGIIAIVEHLKGTRRLPRAQ
jgi:hypothetical protein